jgi:hypothetical protein
MKEQVRLAIMIASPEDRLREAWTKLPAHQQKEVLDFAEFLLYRQTDGEASEESLSEDEHRRLMAALDAVAILSMETGPTVSNRNHDTDLYGKS